MRAAGAAGVGLSPGLLREYARGDAGRGRGRPLGGGVREQPEEALRTVVVGTVMVDPVLVALRRVAQEAVSAQRSAGTAFTGS